MHFKKISLGPFLILKINLRSVYHILVQFPNSVPVIVNLDLTLNFVTLIGRPQCNGRFCWQASLLHLRPSFSSTRMITRTIYVQDLSSGTVLWYDNAIFDMILIRTLRNHSNMEFWSNLSYTHFYTFFECFNSSCLWKFSDLEI